MSASAIIADVRALFAGEPVFLAGSLVAEDVYGLSGGQHADVDLFVPTKVMAVAAVQKMVSAGFVFGDRFDLVWNRWKNYDMGGWHTNSIKMYDSPGGIEYNVVYKLLGKHPVNSLAQVIESFDFGLLATGYDLRENVFRDMRDYLFPGHKHGDPLPLMPNKREAWRAGHISQYNGIREAGRYVKYVSYGHDLSLVKDDLVHGYYNAAAYYSNHFDSEKQLLGKIFETIAKHIEFDNMAQLEKASKEIDYKDELDAIMEALD